jgi:hypothetical protein
MAHKTVAVPPVVVVPLTAFMTDDAIRVSQNTWASGHGSGAGGLVIWAALEPAGVEAADSGNEGDMNGVSSQEMIAGAEAGEEQSGVPHVSEGRRCGECDRGEVCSGVGEEVGIGVGSSGYRAGRGGVQRGGERHRSSSSSKPLNSSTSHRLFAAFLMCFASGGEGASGDSGGEGSCNGGLDGEGLGLVDGGSAKASGRGARGGSCLADLVA